MTTTSILRWESVPTPCRHRHSPPDFDTMGTLERLLIVVLLVVVVEYPNGTVLVSARRFKYCGSDVADGIPETTSPHKRTIDDITDCALACTKSTTCHSYSWNQETVQCKLGTTGPVQAASSSNTTGGWKTYSEDQTERTNPKGSYTSVIRGKLLMLTDNKYKKGDLERYCGLQGGTVFYPYDPDYEKDVVEILGSSLSSDGLWLQMTSESLPFWVDGERRQLPNPWTDDESKLFYNNWDSKGGHDSGNCAYLREDRKTWDNSGCNNQKYSFCEYLGDPITPVAGSFEPPGAASGYSYSCGWWCTAWSGFNPMDMFDNQFGVIETKHDVPDGALVFDFGVVKTVSRFQVFGPKRDRDSAIIDFEVRVGMESKNITYNALCRKVTYPPYPDKQHFDYSVYHFDCECPVSGRYASIMKIGKPKIALSELRFYGW